MSTATMVSVAEAAGLLRVHVRTIHRMIAKGDLSGEKAFEGLRAPFVLDRAEVERLAAERSEVLARAREHAAELTAKARAIEAAAS